MENSLRSSFLKKTRILAVPMKRNPSRPVSYFINIDADVPDMAEYMRRRIELLQKTEAEHFSRDISLERMELNAEKKLI
jgi:hypothetical protein